jgi:hypothetical protein
MDQNRAISIFNDMKGLFDVTMAQIKAYIEKEKEGLREGFQYVLKEQSHKLDLLDFHALDNRVAELAATLSKVSHDNLTLKDQLSTIVYKFQMHRFEDQLRAQEHKVDRLHTFNKELKSKVDYFITFLQTLNLNPAPSILYDVGSSSHAALVPVYSRSGFPTRRPHYGQSHVSITPKGESPLQQEAMTMEEI